jgi:alginate O-acetyltransferase complex protein AlgI
LFFFLPITLTLYLLSGRKLRNIVLLLASLLFYTWGEGKYVSVLLVCIVANYIFAALMEISYGTVNRPVFLCRPKVFLVFGVIFDIGLLFYFKYANFVVENLNLLAPWSGIAPITLSKIHLPLGISFFVFQAISYLIDVYRRDVKATYNPVKFAVYKSLFPQLIAGPIVRYRDVAGQVAHRVITAEGFAIGVSRFITGLGKKVLIANTLAVAADRIFAISGDYLRPGVAWLGAVCYTLQIYFDFSGYSDMAIGLGRMLGFDFLENFNYPYVSKSMQEFWRRWHISLSTWFRDYLYIPVGGNRGGEGKTYFNLMLVFFLCGLWHGASWTFVIWGMWHGLFLILERLKICSIPRRIGRPIGHAYTMLVVTIGWVFFRSANLAYALVYIKAMFGFHAKGFTPYYLSMFLSNDLKLAVIAGVVGSMPIAEFFRKMWMSRASTYSPAVPSAGNSLALANLVFLFAVFFLSAISLAGGTHNPFIYFRF